MDTRRCAYCEALQRADAQRCSRCGHDLSAPVPRAVGPKVQIQASTHRAGHTFGLHPEDQPYQSSMLAAQQRPLADAKDALYRGKQVPELIVFPSTQEAPVLKAQRAALLRQQHKTTSAGQVQPRWPVPTQSKPWFSNRTISSLLTISCIFLLLAASIIAFAFIGQRSTIAIAVIQATPATLRANDTFTLAGRGFSFHSKVSFFHDNNQVFLDENHQPLTVQTDEHGNFTFSVQVPVDWNVGQHQINAVDSTRGINAVTQITVQIPPVQKPMLQLSQPECLFPGAAPGIVSSQSIVLSNEGGGKISWSVASDQDWLSTTPASGTFSGSQSVQVTVNRGHLSPQSYSGHLTFTQKGEGGMTVPLHVAMKVTPAPAALDLSVAALNYSASNSQDPGVQYITLHNSGAQAANWSSTLETGDKAAWFTVSPDHGQIAPDASVTIAVKAYSYHLAVGSYQGSIQFAGGSTARVSVSMNVVEAGNLVLSASALNLTAQAGQTASGQTVTLQNSGGLLLNWEGNVSMVDQGKWLQVTPAQGTLVGGAQTTVTVSADARQLHPGSYQGLVTFTSSSGNSRQIAISLVVSAPVTPAINVQPANLSFVVQNGQNPPAQTLSLHNTGNTDLQWSATIAGIDSSILTVTPAKGTLKPGESATLTVGLHVPVAGLKLSSATILINAVAPGSISLQQKVQVTILNKDIPTPTSTASPQKTK
ncbi:hypothetical protein KDW_13800 [Dictyobacter vulcani]|uniref:MSP domain-containing protein n=1 Tax=Dictyobacter vulcani TaxID=2607529 RepID=A0A5J4KDS3_9CHLR|nr:choice-of-anchor D domain-containing protein [Dictyobacter vulcani]GER87218.1 hypothetical protein KDW_13800 [Dictyobacter vulcani]